MTTEKIAIREGQIWHENDKRFNRYVKVMSSSRSYIYVRTCDIDGNVARRSRLSCIHEPRFIGAFTLIKDTTLQTPSNSRRTSL